MKEYNLPPRSKEPWNRDPLIIFTIRALKMNCNVHVAVQVPKNTAMIANRFESLLLRCSHFAVEFASLYLILKGCFTL